MYLKYTHTYVAFCVLLCIFLCMHLRMHVWLCVCVCVCVCVCHLAYATLNHLSFVFIFPTLLNCTTTCMACMAPPVGHKIGTVNQNASALYSSYGPTGASVGASRLRSYTQIHAVRETKGKRRIDDSLLAIRMF